MNYEKSRDAFKEKLDQEHKWPTWYLFKFIVPSTKEVLITSLFPPDKVRVRSSSQGKYRSISAKMMMESSEEVVKIYEKAHQIEGVLAL